MSYTIAIDINEEATIEGFDGSVGKAIALSEFREGKVTRKSTHLLTNEMIQGDRWQSGYTFEGFVGNIISKFIADGKPQPTIEVPKTHKEMIVETNDVSLGSLARMH